MKKGAFILILILFQLIWNKSSVQAQILSFDVEALTSDTTREEDKIKGLVSLHYDLRQQVNQLSYFNLKAALSRLHEKNLTTVSMNNRLTANGDEGIQNSGFAIIRHLYNYKKDFYPEIFSQYQYDRERGMVSRILFGLNLRSTIVKKEKMKLFLALGVMNENETWDYSGVPDERIPSFHPESISTEYVKTNLYTKFYHKIGEKSSFLTSFYVQFRPDQGLETTRFSPSGTMNVHLVNEFYFTTTFSGIYDYSPVVPIDNFYYSFHNSLAFRF